MRRVAREPQQLELEPERERVERRTGRRAACERVHQVEEARDRLEGPCVRLLLREQAQHRLGTDEADAEPVLVRPGRVVRPDQLDARHRAELAAAVVHHQLDVGERLEARAEARLRAPDALRHRADSAVLERVQVQDPVGLAEAQRAEDDGLGLRRPSGHGSSLERARAEPARPLPRCK